ncbi:MAG: hypothetical protein JXL97_14745 [Bacteroidales bacterium]|nr:hypothetical protein [Bacteroidales bacterium]
MKKLLLTVIFISLLLNSVVFSQNQNVSINNTGAPADNSAILDISATDKGMLIPRMNTGQREAIVAPATGLLVYDTGYNQFWYYSGTGWTAIGGGSGGATISDFAWTDGTDLLRITEDGTNWDVTIDNEADDLSDNIINNLSNVNANPTGTGQILEWDGTQWVAGVDDTGSGGTVITAFSWTDGTNLLRITEGATNWDVYINNEADDLSNNVINDLSNVNASPSNGDFLQWNGSAWIATASGSSCVTLDEAYDCGGNGVGRIITADAGSVEITSATNNAVSFISKHTSNGVAIGAISNSTSNPYAALEAHSVSTVGSFASPVGALFGSYDGTGDWSAGVLGQNTSTAGDAHGVIGISSSSSAGGVYGSNINGFGVIGDAYYGVFGQAENLNGGGVVGQLSSAFGATQAGYLGVARNGYEYAVYADNDILFEGYLDGASGGTYRIGFDATTGNGEVTGMFAKGGGSFKIDHPLDPENKYLYHSFVESPDMMNIYNGIEIFDENGFAKVILPEYFDALNKDYRYQLTAIGASMPNLYIAEEISENMFVIGGGISGEKVSWQVTGVRQDKFANANRVIDEVEKEDYNKGRYIHPTLFGTPKSQGVYLRDPNEKSSENNDSKRIIKKPLDKEAKPKTFLNR